jgi:hypothetical protein
MLRSHIRFSVDLQFTHMCPSQGTGGCTCLQTTGYTVGRAVCMRFKAKLRETEAKFVSLRTKTEFEAIQ